MLRAPKNASLSDLPHDVLHSIIETCVTGNVGPRIARDMRALWHLNAASRNAARDAIQADLNGSRALGEPDDINVCTSSTFRLCKPNFVPPGKWCYLPVIQICFVCARPFGGYLRLTFDVDTGTDAAAVSFGHAVRFPFGHKERANRAKAQLKSRDTPLCYSHMLVELLDETMYVLETDAYDMTKEAIHCGAPVLYAIVSRVHKYQRWSDGADMAGFSEETIMLGVRSLWTFKKCRLLMDTVKQIAVTDSEAKKFEISAHFSRKTLEDVSGGAGMKLYPKPLEVPDMHGGAHPARRDSRQPTPLLHGYDEGDSSDGETAEAMDVDGAAPPHTVIRKPVASVDPSKKSMSVMLSNEPNGAAPPHTAAIRKPVASVDPSKKSMSVMLSNEPNEHGMNPAQAYYALKEVPEPNTKLMLMHPMHKIAPPGVLSFKEPVLFVEMDSEGRAIVWHGGGVHGAPPRQASYSLQRLRHQSSREIAMKEAANVDFAAPHVEKGGATSPVEEQVAGTHTAEADKPAPPIFAIGDRVAVPHPAKEEMCLGLVMAVPPAGVAVSFDLDGVDETMVFDADKLRRATEKEVADWPESLADFETGKARQHKEDRAPPSKPDAKDVAELKPKAKPKAKGKKYESSDESSEESSKEDSDEEEEEEESEDSDEEESSEDSDEEEAIDNNELLEAQRNGQLWAVKLKGVWRVVFVAPEKMCDSEVRILFEDVPPGEEESVYAAKFTFMEGGRGTLWRKATAEEVEEAKQTALPPRPKHGRCAAALPPPPKPEPEPEHKPMENSPKRSGGDTTAKRKEWWGTDNSFDKGVSEKEPSTVGGRPLRQRAAVLAPAPAQPPPKRSREIVPPLGVEPADPGSDSGLDADSCSGSDAGSETDLESSDEEDLKPLRMRIGPAAAMRIELARKAKRGPADQGPSRVSPTLRRVDSEEEAAEEAAAEAAEEAAAAAAEEAQEAAAAEEAEEGPAADRPPQQLDSLPSPANVTNDAARFQMFLRVGEHRLAELFALKSATTFREATGIEWRDRHRARWWMRAYADPRLVRLGTAALPGGAWASRIEYRFDGCNEALRILKEYNTRDRKERCFIGHGGGGTGAAVLWRLFSKELSEFGSWAAISRWCV